MICQSRVEENSLSGVIESKKLIKLERITSVRAQVEVAFKTDNRDLILIGWIFDPESLVLGVSVLFQKQEGLLKKSTYTHWPLEHDIDKVQFKRVKRPDVAHAFAKTDQDGNGQHGLVLMLPDFLAEGRLALAFRDGRFAPLPFVALNDAEQIKQRLKNCWAHSGETLVAILKKAFADDDSLMQMVAALTDEDHGNPHRNEQEDSVKYHVEGACYVNNGLVLIGWTTANEDGYVRINASDEQGWQRDALFLDGVKGLRLIRTFRPDLLGTLSSAAFGKGLHGFVLYWPLCTKPTDTISVWFGGSLRKQHDISVFRLGHETFLALLPLWIHFGNALKAIASQLQDEQMFLSLLEEIEAERTNQANPIFATCDHALLLNNRALILNGWIAKPETTWVRVELVMDRKLFDITSQIKRYPRPDLVSAYPWSGEEALGFLVMVDDPSVLSCNFRLKIICNNGQTQLIRPKVQVMDWPEMRMFLNHHNAIAEPLLKELENSAGWENDPKQLQERIEWLRQGSFMARYAHLQTMVEHLETVIAAIDWAYPLGEKGLLIFGWLFSPNRKQLSVTVHSAEGETIDVADRMFDLARLDVAQSYRPRFPEVNDWCGFVCLAPLPTRPGEARALCFDYGQ